MTCILKGCQRVAEQLEARYKLVVDQGRWIECNISLIAVVERAWLLRRGVEICAFLTIEAVAWHTFPEHYLNERSGMKEQLEYSQTLTVLQ